MNARTEGGSSGTETDSSDGGFSAVVDQAFLRVIWKEKIRPRLRSARLRDLYLPQDALQFGAYEWGLGPFIDRLSSDIEQGQYTPDPANLVRGAKSKGLTRPLAFLSPRDAVLYSAIISLAEPDLNELLSASVGATMQDRARQRASRASAAAEYGDWFAVWMSKQGIVKEIVEHFAYVVESDIANYFPSVDLRIVREHLHSRTSLSRDAVRLCVFLLGQVMRHPAYADAPSLGLPQEPFDTSRVIGHSLLADLDDSFQVEQTTSSYSRFMDDVVIGADGVEDGQRKIAKLQHALEPLGLYPNTAKTRIVKASDYLVEILAEENAYLDAVDDVIEECETRGRLRVLEGLDADLVGELEARAAQHRLTSPESRPMRWAQVLKRFYTLLRRVGSDVLLTDCTSDMRDSPTSARTILEYVRAFPLDADLTRQMVEFGLSVSDVYEDTPLLVFEMIGSAPNADASEIWSQIAQIGLEASQQLVGSVRVASTDRLLASCLPIIAKFGNLEQRASLCDDLWPRLPPESLARLQALPLLISEGRLSASSFNSAVPGLPWSTVLNVEFLRAVESGDLKASGVAIGLLEPVIRLLPNRYHIHARPLLTLGLLRRVSADRLANAIPKRVARLQTNPPKLRDHRSELLLNRAAE